MNTDAGLTKRSRGVKAPQVLPGLSCITCPACWPKALAVQFRRGARRISRRGLILAVGRLQAE